jgi:microcystin-dependent protein
MDAFIGEIRAFAFDYAPEGWLPCNGQQLPVAQFTALCSVIGGIYGPMTNTYFTMPNIPGKVLVGSGQLPGGNNYTVGQQKVAGEKVLLKSNHMPPHTHDFMVAIKENEPYGSLQKMPENGAAVSNFGTDTTPVKAGKGYAKELGTTPCVMALTALDQFGSEWPKEHNNMQPYLAINYCMNYDGLYPVRP